MSGIGLGEAHGPLRVWSVLGAGGWLGRCSRPVLCRVDNGLGWRTGDRRDMVLCSLMGRFGAEMSGGVRQIRLFHQLGVAFPFHEGNVLLLQLSDLDSPASQLSH